MQELLHEHKTFTEPKLVHLDLETSSICNLSCQMCPRPKENGTMPIGDIKRLIKEFADMGGVSIKPFWRGEPTIDERMPDILKYAKELNLKTMLNTNAAFPSNSIHKILDYTDLISLSIDEEHDNINKINLFISLLVHRKIINPYLYIEVQATTINPIVRYLCDKFDFVYKVDKPTKRSNKDTTSEVITGERKYCKFPEWRMVIDWQGNCTMCCVDWDLQNAVGNIYHNSLKEIFYGDIANQLRQNLKQEIYTTNICKQCPSRSSYK